MPSLYFLSLKNLINFHSISHARINACDASLSLSLPLYIYIYIYIHITYKEYYV